MKAVRVAAAGGPDAMRLAEVPDPQPREGEALVRIDAAGVNFIDVYHRSGAYPVPFPLVPGQEGAGTVLAVGRGVSEVAVGDRVAFASGPGTYADLASVQVKCGSDLACLDRSSANESNCRARS